MRMDREAARQEVRARWREFGPRDRSGRGIICPICGNGEGSDGDGIRENPKKPGSLSCFKCGFHGDSIDLYKAALNLSSYNEALQAAADFLGITIEDYEPGTGSKNYSDDRAQAPESDLKEKPAGTPTEPENAPQGKQAAPRRAPEDFTPYYKACKERVKDPAAISYLQARGISPETAAAYWIGYDPEWVSPTVLKRQREKGSSWTPPGTARIILPVSRNHYIARAIGADVEKKYQKMNETGGGDSGIFNSRSMYSGNEAVFITEGFFDALSIIEAGGAALALNSTSNIDMLLRQLQREPTKSTFILCLDNDRAGVAASEKLRAGLAQLGIRCTTAAISGNHKDPNEALTADREKFINAVMVAQAQTAAKPDSTATYIDHFMNEDIARVKAAADVKTGFYNLDKESGGLYPGLYALGAISSLGKTSFALQIADNLAATGHDVLFFSLEMSRLELVSKSLARTDAQICGDERPVNSLMFRRGCFPDRLQAAAAAYKEKVSDRMSIIEGNFSCNISFIGEYVRHYIERNGRWPVVFVDYLQIIQSAPDFKRTSTKEAVDNIITELKRLSRDLDLTVFVISSVNRGNYMLPIDFEAFKESGGIEYSCDVVWGLQLQCLSEPLFDTDSKRKIGEKRERIRKAKAANPRKIELVCLKNRFGRSSYSCGFKYYPAKDLFEEIQEGEAFAPREDTNPFENPDQEQETWQDPEQMSFQDHISALY